MKGYLYYYPIIERDEEERRCLTAALQTLKGSGFKPAHPEDAKNDWWIKSIESALERLCDDDVSSSSELLEEVWNSNPTEDVKGAVMTLLTSGLQMKKEFLLA